MDSDKNMYCQGNLQRKAVAGRTCELLRLLHGTPCFEVILNRRMPNGMYGGVRGVRKSPLLDLCVSTGIIVSFKYILKHFLICQVYFYVLMICGSQDVTFHNVNFKIIENYQKRLRFNALLSDNIIAVSPILATERRCVSMEIIVSFIISVLAGVISYYICKWLDGNT
ncbi:MAG: hypothetical protein NC305_06665 [Lachnospiraceae bacterium]|nr:hypothetical protein [Butyrivibrio sp.]MCM1410215.1 hypothetical protein [Lachnospiraceae bacterium]